MSLMQTTGGVLLSVLDADETNPSLSQRIAVLLDLALLCSNSAVELE